MNRKFSLFTLHIAERLAVERSLPVITTYVSHGWDSNIQSSAFGENGENHCATAAN